MPAGVAADAPDADVRFRYEVGSRCVASLSDAGATVFCLPWQPDRVAHLLDHCDGVLIPGGPFLNEDPRDFIERYHGTTPARVYHRRVRFEMMVAREALKRRMPILGICGGHQMLNAAMGGTFIVSLADSWPNPIPHRDEEVRTRTAHSIAIEPGSMLAALNGGALEAQVNTSHRQAIKDPAPGLDVIARAPDGVIEAVAVRDYPFGLGVQWHPEFRLTELDRSIITAFVAATRAAAAAH